MNRLGHNRAFATIAQAADGNGLWASDKTSLLSLLAIPAGLWLLAELAFGRLLRRKASKFS